MVARDLQLAALTGAHLHIAHVSAAGSVDQLRAAREAGIKVTAEVTPHHLALIDSEVLGYDTNRKMAPPLRSARDREVLIEGLRDGTIDCVATDHAPHAHHEKDVDFVEAPFGVVGFETALGVVLDLVHAGQLSPLEAVSRLSTRPARIFGLRAGTLEVGAPADLVLIDPEAAWKVEARSLRSKSKNSAFLGAEMRGRAVRTWVEGRCVYELGAEGPS
jgi:dihydroorotase